ncbi:hypothetical protein [Nitrosomonas sp. Nm58]|uniref:hypothetical protein n=1 Tax=Nitrosomonas sp. Nm58 TaxID=200126 RepID=UPI0008947C5E|nr:hypothetical protein [Nitrosomonas sp. Nm58]SDZ08976.1 hypothetical protein SAMN05421754_105614 [Nitrosomonas sp. Nm58]
MFLVPQCAGVIYDQLLKEELWDKFCTEHLRDGDNPSSNTTESSEPEGFCATRHGINPKTVTKWRKRGCFVCVDIAEVSAEEDKLYLFIAVDRMLRFAYVELHDKSDREISAGFVDPFQHTVWD